MYAYETESSNWQEFSLEFDHLFFSIMLSGILAPNLFLSLRKSFYKDPVESIASPTIVFNARTLSQVRNSTYLLSWKAADASFLPRFCLFISNILFHQSDIFHCISGGDRYPHNFCTIRTYFHMPCIANCK